MSAYKTLSKLRAVCEIERLTAAAESSAETERYDHSSVGMADFAAFVEPVLAQRCALLSLDLGGRGGGQQPRHRPRPQSDLVEQSLRYAEACRANGLHQLALNRLAGLKELKQLSDTETARYDNPYRHHSVFSKDFCLMPLNPLAHPRLTHLLSINGSLVVYGHSSLQLGVMSLTQSSG